MIVREPVSIAVRVISEWFNLSLELAADLHSRSLFLFDNN
jgi:hypothetical protein